MMQGRFQGLCDAHEGAQTGDETVSKPHPSLPPGPSGRFLPTLRYLRDPYGFYEDARRRYGDLFSMNSMNGQLVLALDAEGARQILAGREEDFVVGFGTEAVLPVIGPGSLLLTSGDRHRRDRKMLSPTFHGGRMRAYAEDIAASALSCTEDWKPGRELVLLDVMLDVSSSVIRRTVFGVTSPELSETFRVASREAINEIPSAPIFFKFLQREFGGIGPWARFRRRMRRFDELIYARIAHAREHPGGEDILSKMIALESDDGVRLGDAEIRDHVLTLLIAGQETTATSLAWVLYELMRHPETLAWLRDELAGLGDDPSPEQLAASPALDAVIRESLRLHPILLEFMRTVKTGFEIKGWTIPAGVTLGAAIPMIHRDPTLYPEPERYRPQRFLERGFAPHEFASFGGGHRHCLGAAFAMHEMKIVVGLIVQRFELSLASSRPLRSVRRNLILAPEGGVAARVESIRKRSLRSAA
jgi:cytochrome P450